VFDDFPSDLNYKLVINHEEQYGIWPTKLGELKGWENTKTTGSKKEIEQKLTNNEELRAKVIPADMQAEMAKRARALLNKD
jgi:uncharacterized protein YbdZ (MbtH family)